jgi:hypothetical protein
MDRAIGLALFPKERRRLVWVDESSEVFKANSLGPNARTLLTQSRHFYTSAIICNPRPVGLDPMVIGQADWVVMYDMPHPIDRQRVAEVIGWPPKQLNDALDEIRRRGEYWYLMFDAKGYRMRICPPLPIDADHGTAEL